ncbi:MAG: hypothetical protein OEL20_07190 [Sulfuritalea sp.]|jgi:hypothetical protein|nr:hypothetical protein [Sulfuritalea sp.]
MQFIVSRCRLFLLALFMFSVIGTASPAVAQTADGAAFEAALTHFNRARQGDADQIDAAIEAFQAAPANPALQPLYSAYLGSAYALKAKAAWMPWKKLKLSEQGLDHIDGALAALRSEHDRLLVQGTPVSLATRVVAAATFVALPDGIFHRRAAGKSLLAEMQRSPLLASAPAGFRAELVAVETGLRESGK